MIQLRKICNHPFLIRGAEEHLTSEIHSSHLTAEEKANAVQETLMAVSSKFVFLDKLLVRLRENNKRVLIFSQMVRLLDILEDYLRYRKYPFERLDGGVRRSERQEAIDRFMDPETDSFVFLLGTRAGGLGLNLTIADTVVLFDTDW